MSDESVGGPVDRDVGHATVQATWHAELTCDCPACGQYVDLLEYPDFWDGRKVEVCSTTPPERKAWEWCARSAAPSLRWTALTDAQLQVDPGMGW